VAFQLSFALSESFPPFGSVSESAFFILMPLFSAFSIIFLKKKKP